MIKVAHADPLKLAILSKSLQTHDVQVSTFKPLSLLELQSLRRKNRKQEHSFLVEKFKEDYGGSCKASKSLGVNWKKFHKMYKPPVMKKRMKQVWVDIKKFYQ